MLERRNRSMVEREVVSGAVAIADPPTQPQVIVLLPVGAPGDESISARIAARAMRSAHRLRVEQDSAAKELAELAGGHRDALAGALRSIYERVPELSNADAGDIAADLLHAAITSMTATEREPHEGGRTSCDEQLGS
ncbi:MAG: hypothetical protein ACXW1S_01115 [Acidimicrobiia bacterium]